MPGETNQNDPTHDSRTVLVFGATGQQGGAVADALIARGWSVRALVRDPGDHAAKALAARGVRLFKGSFSDRGSIRNAMAGVYGVFSIQPNSGSASSGVSDVDEVRFGKTVADIAIETGVGHLVYTSAGIISQGPTGMANLDCKIEIEDYIRSTGIVATIVRPATFMTLMTLNGMGLDQGNFTFFMRPDQAFQVIAVQDIGKIVATIFENGSRFFGRTIDIAGDEMTGLELQDALSDASGRPITYHRFPDELLASNEFLGRNAKLFDEGRAAGNANIAALKGEFGDLLSFTDWLTGPGMPLLQVALEAGDQPVSLR